MPALKNIPENISMPKDNKSSLLTDAMLVMKPAEVRDFKGSPIITFTVGKNFLRELRIGELEEVLSLQKRERDPELSCELK